MKGECSVGTRCRRVHCVLILGHIVVYSASLWDRFQNSVCCVCSADPGGDSAAGVQETSRGPAPTVQLSLSITAQEEGDECCSQGEN